MSEAGIILIIRNMILCACLVNISCGESPGKNPAMEKEKGLAPEARIKSIPGYNFNHPDEILTLPAILHEISGVTVMNDSTVACIQDENGIVFYYDLKRKIIANLVNFYSNGDYEGIAKAGSLLYVLRSDGVLFEISNPETSEIANAIPLNSLRGYDNEGLCFDKKKDRLLIAPKNNPEKEAGLKGKRVVYGFDLKKRELIKQELYMFDLTAIKVFAVNNKVYPYKTGKKEKLYELPDIKFRPSAIAIHPLTGRLYVVSSADPLLAVFNIYGNIENLVRLDDKLFNMPEGITFLSNGDLLISNEGQKGNATIIRMNYKP